MDNTVRLWRSDVGACVATLHGRVHADFRDEQAYFTIAFDLILNLYQSPLTDQTVADLRESLRGAEIN